WAGHKKDQWSLFCVSCARYQNSMATTVNRTHIPRPSADFQGKGIGAGAFEEGSFGSGPEMKWASNQTERKQAVRIALPSGSCHFEIASTPYLAPIAARKNVRPTLQRNAITAPESTSATLLTPDARYSSPKNKDTMNVA